MKKEDDIKVSVICTVYNHENFLKKCLDGFVMQKTNFPFEVIVHDDASTDHSADIIKEYAKHFPNLFKPVLQEENQYSKGINVMQDIILPVCKGKYIALCEGDDYWIDKSKLQIQYDFMENNPECSMCVHNTKIHDLMGDKPDRDFYKITKPINLSEYQVFFGWGVHTSSYFLRKEYAKLDQYMHKYFFGDYVILVNAFTCGQVCALPNTMSVYNMNNVTGMTYEMLNQSKKGNTNKILQRKSFLEEFDLATKGEYSEIVKQRILEVDFSVKKIEVDYEIKLASDRRKTTEGVKSLISDVYYNVFKNQLTIKEKVYCCWKYEGYKLGWIWWQSFVLKKTIREKRLYFIG